MEDQLPERETKIIKKKVLLKATRQSCGKPWLSTTWRKSLQKFKPSSYLVWVWLSKPVCCCQFYRSSIFILICPLYIPVISNWNSWLIHVNSGHIRGYQKCYSRNIFIGWFIYTGFMGSFEYSITWLTIFFLIWYIIFVSFPVIS